MLENREQHSQEDKSPGEQEEYLRGFGDFQASVIQLLKGHGGAPADLYVAELRTHCKSEKQAETAFRIGGFASLVPSILLLCPEESEQVSQS